MRYYNSEEELWNEFEQLALLSEAGHSETILARSRCSSGYAVIKETVAEKRSLYEQLAVLAVEIPGIAGVIGWCESQDFGNHCYVIENFINGRTLEARVRQEGLFTESEMIECICRLCSILQGVHKHKIVHRDITPNNILLDGYGQVWLIDFGISRVQKRADCQDTTILGTPGYAAPEMFGYTQTDARADIFALGVLMNWMLTGQLPGDGLYRGDKKIENIIRVCTATDKKQRYESVMKLRNRLSNGPMPEMSLPVRTFRSVPGYRSMKWWKVILASLYYFYILMMLMLVVIPLSKNFQWENFAIALWMLGSFWIMAEFEPVDRLVFDHIYNQVLRWFMRWIVIAVCLLTLIIVSVVVK